MIPALTRWNGDHGTTIRLDLRRQPVALGLGKGADDISQGGEVDAAAGLHSFDAKRHSEARFAGVGQSSAILLVSCLVNFYSHWVWTSMVRRQNRSTEARMSSAVLVQRKGLGSALRASM